MVTGVQHPARAQGRQRRARGISIPLGTPRRRALRGPRLPMQGGKARPLALTPGGHGAPELPSTKASRAHGAGSWPAEPWVPTYFVPFVSTLWVPVLHPRLRPTCSALVVRRTGGPEIQTWPGPAPLGRAEGVRTQGSGTHKPCSVSSDPESPPSCQQG